MIENPCSCIFLYISVNCIDRHLETRSDKVALIWEKDEPGQEEFMTYKLVLSRVYYRLTFTQNCFVQNISDDDEMKLKLHMVHRITG